MKHNNHWQLLKTGMLLSVLISGQTVAVKLQRAYTTGIS
jgi:hypothetical protein